MLGVGYGGSFHLWCRSDVKGEDALGGNSHSSYSYFFSNNPLYAVTILSCKLISVVLSD
jgi:hypothetical protein